MTVAGHSLPPAFASSNRLGQFLPVAMIVCILALVVPLPAWMLDLAIALNIAVSTVILLTTLTIRHPLEFSVFPTLLLLTTLFRLVLNISATRLILTESGPGGTTAAGDLIDVFGRFMADGQLAVGLILFVILLLVQFLVVNQGAARISEVAARFALDGLPGRQAAIDADLQSGSINASQASERRQQLSRHAEFYGAMDGANRFLKGDAFASLIITVINLTGGLYLAASQHGLTWQEAVETVGVLTIGDGLVIQLPAFLVALAAAFLTTRSANNADLSTQMASEVLVRSETLLIAALLMVALACIGLPKIPLLALAAGLTLAGLWSRGRARTASRQEPDPSIAAKRESSPADPVVPPSASGSPEEKLFVEPLELELGVELLSLTQGPKSQSLLDGLSQVRSDIAMSLGSLIPRVKVRDNLALARRQYCIRILEAPVARGEIFPRLWLAVEGPGMLGVVPGHPTIDPVTDRAGRWIEDHHRERALVLGYQVFSPTQQISRHLAEVVKIHAAELLSRQHVHQLLDALRRRAPRLVDELVPGIVSPGVLHQVLGRLLAERVPIRNLETILETLGDNTQNFGDLPRVTEVVRQGLARTICQQHRDSSLCLRVITLEPELEARLTQRLSDREITISPVFHEAVLAEVRNQVEWVSSSGHRPVLLTTAVIREPILRLLNSSLPGLVVLCTQEITQDTQVQVIAQVQLDDLESLTDETVTPVRSSSTPPTQETGRLRHPRQPLSVASV